MAKKSLIIKNEQRRELAERHRERRLELKHIISSPATSASERENAIRALARMPRDASPSRVRNRDVIDGRPRAVTRAFGLSRVNLRRMAHAGELPGLVKSSW